MAEQGEPREPTPAEAREDSRKRLEEMVAWSTGAAVSDRNVAGNETSYVGSMIDEEYSGHPEGVELQMRQRAVEKPLAKRVGYHEAGEEAEEADEEWVTGEATQISGGGARGSRNCILTICLPLFLVVTVICLHNWWYEFRVALSAVVDKTNDAFDRRLLEDDMVLDAASAEAAGDSEARAGESARSLAEGSVGGKGKHKTPLDKAVYTVDLGDQGANAEDGAA